MEKQRKITLVFEKDESAFFDMIERYCAGKTISPAEYLMELVKRDLAWGHFTRRKKKRADD